MALDKLVIKGAREHNLKNIDLEIPRDKLIVFTGLSGSGKSSLINEILFKRLTKELTNPRMKPGKHKDIVGIEFVDKVIEINS